MLRTVASSENMLLKLVQDETPLVTCSRGGLASRFLG
jgi:hypothetical protein